MYQLRRSKTDVQYAFTELNQTKEYNIKPVNSKSIQDTIQETLKSLFVIEPSKETSNTTLKDKSITSPKEEVETSPKEEVETSPKEEDQTFTKEEVETFTKEEVETSPKEEDQTSPKEEVETFTKEEDQTFTKEEVETFTKEEDQTFTKEEDQTSPKEEDQTSPKEEVETSPKEEVETNETDPFESFTQIEEPEEEPIDILEDVPLILYDYNNESYYLDNAHFLERKFDDLPDGLHTVNLCIYTCVRNGCMPYLLYLTVYDKLTGSLVFPSTTEVVEIVESDTDTDVQNKIMETFKDALFDIYPPNETKPMDMENEEPTDLYNPHLFRGFFRHKENNTILMVYDATRINIPVNEDKEYFWASPYEILILNQMRNLKIDPTITNTFKNIAISGGFIDHSFYRLRKESDKSLVSSPYILFPCSRSSGGGFNLFGASSSFENIRQEEDNKINLLVPTVDHPKIGNFPLFSAMPLDPNVPPFKRYAVFVDIDEMKPFFVEETNNDVLDNLYGMNHETQYSSICFFQDNVQYWVIKSPLYFTEINDDLQKNIPISTFQEKFGLIETKTPEKNEGSLVLSNEVDETGSNEGDETGSNEGDETGSNEGDETGSNEDSDDPDQQDEPDEYKRGYAEGYQEALQKL